MNNQNLILDIEDVTTESGLPDEPVTLEQMKDYLRLEGFMGEESSASEFDFDDTLLTEMITAARGKCEKFCGISIVSHSWKVLLTNCAGDIELPYGPVSELTSIIDKDDNDITTYKLRGFNFRFLESPTKKLMTLEYDAGYDSIPAELTLGIKQMVWYWYNNRGTIDQTSLSAAVASLTIPEIALGTIRPFKRVWTWLA